MLKKSIYIIALLTAFIQQVQGQESSLLHNLRVGQLADSLSFDPLLKPFYHGIASGDPLQDRVIIWTRVTPEKNGTIQGTWTVATDTGMVAVVSSGEFTTDSTRDYTVKIDVTGLKPNTTYYYMFSALGANSLRGRTKTAAVADDAEHLRFAVVSCSNYEAGYFNAYARIANRNDIDAVIHLGDYFYEYESGRYGDTTLNTRRHQDFETVRLNQYRLRYSLYRLDKDLRHIHQQHPFITVWDDHESANDAYKDGAENHNDSTEGDWTSRKSFSRKAYYEWLPVREGVESTIYRRLNYGNLAEWIMIDTRLEGREKQIESITDPALYSPTRTLLGEKQLKWFQDALKTSTAKWKLIGNQVIFAEFHVGWIALADPRFGTSAQVEGLFLDIWDGYPAERLKIINFIRENKIDNVVFTTGDFHSAFAYDIADTVSNPAAFYAPVKNYDPKTGKGSVAVEFVTPSITSANFDENLDPQTSALVESLINKPLPLVNTVANPHMKYVDLDRHGYFILDVKSDSVQANYYYVDRLDSISTVEKFDAAFAARANANHLTAAAKESAPKAIQALPAPLKPKNIPTATQSNLSATLALMGVYPNPASRFHIVQYAIQQREQVTVELVDVQGKRIAELVDQVQSAGVYNLEIQRKNLPAGVYLLKVRAGGSLATAKLIYE